MGLATVTYPGKLFNLSGPVLQGLWSIQHLPGWYITFLYPSISIGKHYNSPLFLDGLVLILLPSILRFELRGNRQCDNLVGCNVVKEVLRLISNA